jgi:hypothetical protein
MGEEYFTQIHDFVISYENENGLDLRRKTNEKSPNSQKSSIATFGIHPSSVFA